MMLEINQSAMHVLIDLYPYGPHSGRYMVRKEWHFDGGNSPSIEPALLRPGVVFFQGNERGAMLPETAIEHIKWLQVCIGIANQLDNLFKTREDFKRTLYGYEMGDIVDLTWIERKAKPEPAGGGE